MLSDHLRQQWHQLAILGIISTLILINSFLGGALVNFNASYFTQAFDQQPVERIFPEATPAQLPLLIPLFAFLQGGFIIGAIFFWLRIHLFLPEQQVVSKGILSSLTRIGIGLAAGVIITSTYAEFYTATDEGWRTFMGLALTFHFFNMLLYSSTGLAFGLLLYRARQLPMQVICFTCGLNILALLLNMLFLNSDLPDGLLSGSLTTLGADILYWTVMLWLWSRPAVVDTASNRTGTL